MHMKAIFGIVTLVVVVAVAAGVYGYRPYRTPTADLTEPLPSDMLDASHIASGPSDSLSDTERAALLEMREEEKLAHDVYMALGNTAGVPIFANIARSEQTHTGAVQTLLEQFGIEDPVRDAPAGTFSSPKHAMLYTQLSAQGGVSLEAALRVGALIEDLDIADLERHLAEVRDPAIRTVFENLMRGSRNHLRSFSAQLSARGAVYVPSHISSAEYQAIVSSPRETGPSVR